MTSDGKALSAPDLRTRISIGIAGITVGVVQNGIVYFLLVYYSEVLGLEPSLAGPKRPQDRISLGEMKNAFQQTLVAPRDKQGFELDDEALRRSAVVSNGQDCTITHGAVVIAAITSCTNTNNPSVMLAAGLLAKKATEKGLQVPSYVKTSLAPGSRVVSDYLDKAGLTQSLQKLGVLFR